MSVTLSTVSLPLKVLLDYQNDSFICLGLLALLNSLFIQPAAEHQAGIVEIGRQRR